MAAEFFYCELRTVNCELTMAAECFYCELRTVNCELYHGS